MHAKPLPLRLARQFEHDQLVVSDVVLLEPCFRVVAVFLKPAGDQPSDLAGRAKQRQRLAQEFLVCGSVVDLVFQCARIHFTSFGAGAGGVRAGSSFTASHNDMAIFPTPHQKCCNATKQPGNSERQ
ncbi:MULTISPECIES: hypothetical protein [Mesorhizobium]|uniref:hypothetical protein n=1 Tax=Mesorhizobium sp. TaxID=1871066 RepID=UPI000A903DF0|nr:MULTISPECIES: hypothetical protein [Mesorhizobium]